MRDQDKTKEQLIGELTELRQRVAELEASEAERERAEEALRASEEELRLTLGATTGGIWKLNFETTEFFFSPRYYTMLGYEPDEFPATYQSWGDLIHPDDLESALCVATEYLATKPDLYENEFRLRTKVGDYKWIRARARVVERNEKGETVRMIGNHEDITKRKRAEEQLRAAELLQRTVIESLDEALHLIDTELCIHLFNGKFREWSQQLGFEAGPVGKHIQDVFPFLSDTVISQYQQVLITGEPLITQEETTFDERVIITETRKIPVKTGEKVTGVLTIVADITERKQMEEALRESEQKFRSIVEQSNDGIVLTHEQGTIIEWSQGQEQITGLKRAEVLGKPLWDIQFQMSTEERRTPDLYESLKTSQLEFYMTGQASWLHQLEEVTIQRPDGTYRVLQSMVFPISTDSGFTCGAISRDITERKQMEEALRESERKFRSIVEQSLQGLVTLTSDGIVFANTAFAEMIGCTVEESMSFSIDDVRALIHPDDQTFVWGRFRDRLAGKPVPQRYEFRLIQKDGTVRWVEMLSSRIEHDGKPATQGALVDITERKLAEETLRESEERLRTAGMAAYDLIYEWDVVYDALEWFGDIDGLLGYRKGEISRDINAWLDLIHSEDRVKLENAVELHRTSTKPILYEYRIRHKDGTYRHWNDHGLPLLDDKGRPYKWIGVCTDTTEHKQVEKALQESETRYRALFEQANDAIFLRNENDEILDVNRRASEMLGYSREELLAMRIPDLQAPEVRGEAESVVRGEWARYGNVPFEALDIHRDGTRIPVEISIARVEGLKGNLYISIVRDVTEHKRAEEELRRSEERYRTLFEAIPVGLYRTTPDGQLLDANQAMARMLGYPDRESLLAINATDLYVDPKDRRQWQTLLEAEGVTRNYKVQLLRRDGAIIWGQESARAIRDDEGRALYYDGTIEDITERIQAEEALRENETRFRALSNATFEGIAFTKQGVIVDANQQYADLFGYEINQVQGLDAGQLVAPEDRELVRNKILAGNEEPYEHRALRKDGTVIFVEVRPRMMSIEGQPMRVTAVRDITERKRAEEELQDSRKRLKLFIDSSHDLYFLKDRAAKYLLVNTANAQFFGKKEADIIGKTDFDLMPEEVAQACSESDSRAIEEKKMVISVENVGERVYETRKIPVITDDNVVGVAGIIRDITERKRAEEEIRQRVFEQEALRKAMLALTTTLDRDEVIDRILAQLQDVVPYDTASVQLLREDCLEIVGGRGFPNLEELLGITFDPNREDNPNRKVVRTQASFIVDDAPTVYEGFLRHPHAPAGIRSWLGVPMLVGEQLIGVIALDKSDPGFYTQEHAWMAEAFAAQAAIAIENAQLYQQAQQEIFERKQIEEERERLLVQIQEQARRMQQIMDTVPEGVLLLNTNGQVVLANPAAGRHLDTLAGARMGDTLTHLGNRPLAEFLTSPPKGLWHEIAMDDKVFELIARPMENGPEPDDWVLVINDMTQQREIEQRIQQQERLAAVGQLAAGIAHDFNNIMATIVLYAQMTARMEELPSIIRERMETINQQAGHATKLILQILDFSRRAVLERQPLDLTLLLKEHVRLLKRTLPENIEIELAYELDEYAAPLTVNADPTRMQQMVTNLAVNSRDAMPGGGTLYIGLERIKVRPGESPLLPEMEAGEWLKVTVADTGTGIPPDALPHIFEPFFTTRAPLGSGLGLAQIHGIVGQHGGRIDVETQVGKGTTFTIYLPALPTSPSKPSGVSPLGELPTLPTGRGETILVVEDDAIVRKALMEGLELLNYRVLEAANGQEALAMLEQHSGEIDLLLSDVVMPEMGGIALLHALRQRALAVPVVMLTGHPLEKEMEELRAQGMTDWLTKPPELKQLAEVVARALGNAIRDR